MAPLVGGVDMPDDPVKKYSSMMEHIAHEIGSIAEALDETPKEYEEREGTLSQREAVSAIGNLLVGSGMLALPFAFCEAGWAAAGVIAAVTGVMLLTGLLIGWAFDAATPLFEASKVPVQSRDFAAIAYLAFGARGQALIGLVFTVELWTALETFLVMIGININIVLGVPRTLAIICSGAMSFVLLYAPMRILAYLSMISVVAILGSAGAFVLSGAVLFARDELPAYDAYHSDFRASGLYAALGLSMYCFAGHPCLPAIYWGMRDRSKFTGACLGGFAFAGAFYLVVSGLGYLFLGDFVNQSFTSNIGQDLQGNLIHSVAGLRVLAAGCFAVKLQGTLPMVLAPVFALLESSVGLANTGVKVTIFRAATLTLSVALALCCQDILSSVCDAMGCALTMSTSVIFPCAMFCRLCDVSVVAKAGLAAIGCLGLLLGVQGTLDALGAHMA